MAYSKKETVQLAKMYIEMYGVIPQEKIDRFITNWQLARTTQKSDIHKMTELVSLDAEGMKRLFNVK